MIKKVQSQKTKTLFGVGLRPSHFPIIESEYSHQLDWFEVVTENFIDTQGRPLKILEKARRSCPVALHGVSLSIGSEESVDLNYLRNLKNLIERIEPVIVSDHFCWTGGDAKNLHDLMPIPFTQENVAHMSRKLDQVQSFIGRQILLENVSSYITYESSEMAEWDFINDVARKSGCGVLLDLNNVYVSAQNNGFDSEKYIESISPGIVKQIHLAGYTDMGTYLFDTHSKPVYPHVWELYKKFIEIKKDVPVIVEWDENVPQFEILQAEALTAKKIWQDIYG